jgi:hypothetical protein
MIFEIDDLHRVRIESGGGVVQVLVVDQGPKRRHQWVPDARPRSGKSYAEMRLPAPGSAAALEREQAIEEGAIASECLPQILGRGLVAI